MRLTVLTKIPFIIGCLPVWADLTDESIRVQQHQQALENRLTERQFTTFDTPPPILPRLVENESPCFPIHQISLRGNDHHSFAFLIPTLKRQIHFRQGMCLGQENLRLMLQTAQNLLIEKGFITSRIALEDQDLSAGELTFTLYAGYLGDIKFREKQHTLTHLGKVSSFPITSGKILNLHDIEQGLENLRYLSSNDVHIDIAPSSLSQQSDLIVYRSQAQQIFGSLGMDNLGSITTGKYQGNATFSIHSLFGLNDLFYASYYQDLGHHKVKLRDDVGQKTESGHYGYSVHYSVPFGYWLWQFNSSRNKSHDATEGAFVNYDYSGTNIQTNTSLSRILYRDQQQKWTLGGKLWRTKIGKYLDGNEIEVQRRKMAGWQVHLQHQWQQGGLQLNSQIHYKRGIGFKSLPALEEFADEDTLSGKSRMKIWRANVNITYPFSFSDNTFSLQSFWQIQWHKTPLVPQDKLALGSIYTVRGFNGEQTLQGERGWAVQNNLNWHFQPNHQIYIGWDYGRVSGNTAQFYPRKQLSGAALDITGRFTHLEYEINLAKPLIKPAYFDTNPNLFGFSLNYHF